MFVSFLLSFCLWSVLCLYRNSDGFYFKWREPPKLLLAPLILILSLLSTLLPDFHQPIIIASEAAHNYLPVSYPFGVHWFTSLNMKMSNWLIWFLTPDLGFTLSFPGYIHLNIILVNLLISSFFFLINYFSTLILLNRISSYLIDSRK